VLFKATAGGQLKRVWVLALFQFSSLSCPSHPPLVPPWPDALFRYSRFPELRAFFVPEAPYDEAPPVLWRGTEVFVGTCPAPGDSDHARGPYALGYICAERVCATRSAIASPF